MNKFLESIKNIINTKFWIVLLSVFVVIILVILSFSAGMMVGFRKASFGRDWGEHYRENFGMGYGMHAPGFRMSDSRIMGRFPNPNGAVGKILKIELPNITIQDKDGIEKIITIDVNTSILSADKNIKPEDLKIDDFVVSIGAPNDKGIIVAKFVRLLPAPDFLK